VAGFCKSTLFGRFIRSRFFIQGFETGTAQAVSILLLYQVLCSGRQYDPVTLALQDIACFTFKTCPATGTGFKLMFYLFFSHQKLKRNPV
jgi:hypothetical protein